MQKEEIFKYVEGIGTEPGPFWGRKTKKYFTKCESKEKCLKFLSLCKENNWLGLSPSLGVFANQTLHSCQVPEYQNVKLT